MIKLSTGLKREYIRAAIKIEDVKNFIDVDETKHKDVLREIFNFLNRKGYDVIEKDITIRISKSKGTTLDYIYLEINIAGSGGQGEFNSFVLESSQGEPFDVIYVYDKDFEEVDQLEI